MAKAKNPLTLGRALDLLTNLDSEQSAAEREAVEAVRYKFNGKRAAIVERVPEEMRGRLGAMLDAVSAPAPCIDPHFDDIPDVTDETPSRPMLEEYDGVPERLREPLSPERLAIARKR